VKLDDICIVNSDVTASDDFYRKAVGLERRMRNVRFADFVIGTGPRLAMWLRPSIAETVGSAYPSAPGLPFRVTVALTDARAVDAAASRSAGSIRLSESPRAPGAPRYAVTDPDGFVTVLTTSPGGREGILEIELAVSDPVRTFDFLERLGFRPKAVDGGMHFDGGGVVLSVVDIEEATSGAQNPSEFASFTRTGGHVMLAVELDSGDRVDELHAELTARGLVASGPPAVFEWGARSTYFVDPDGYIWEIYAWVEEPR
jgi:catechol 2,3-dioxygenase-like lactoylglutathione lyase family enzyme